jgi:hypothetical protein
LKKGSKKVQWMGYELGHIGIGIAPVQFPDKTKALALWITVGEEAFPLALYPDKETAAEGQQALDSAMEALEELHDKDDSCCAPDEEKEAPKSKGKSKPAAAKAPRGRVEKSPKARK